jgi:hypothetical protein
MSVPCGVCVTYSLPESAAEHDEELQLKPLPPHHPSDWLQDSSSELDPPSILCGSFSDKLIHQESLTFSTVIHFIILLPSLRKSA